MLRFALVPPHTSSPSSVDAERNDSACGIRLYSTLASVPATEERILVVDDRYLSDEDMQSDGDTAVVSFLPADAIQNLGPYRPPVPVVAGGGYVVRSCASASDSDVALLLIFRRGVWDLPKGTQEPGESIEACALREVREEVGICDLGIRRAVGTTVHGYPDGETYAVKTTYWYLMQTPERHFTPEREEGIRRVAWARWGTARTHIGYETLAHHMDTIASAAYQAVGISPPPVAAHQ